MCSYDAQEHSPKLLPCSHTVCRSCLERIVDASRDRSQIRCPICRGSIPLPAGGVGSFPPSFLVNQLLDLMARQRRDVIPKCTLHAQQELMFCETCDEVFCIDCTGKSRLSLSVVFTIPTIHDSLCPVIEIHSRTRMNRSLRPFYDNISQDTDATEYLLSQNSSNS